MRRCPICTRYQCRCAAKNDDISVHEREAQEQERDDEMFFESLYGDSGKSRC